MFARQARAYLSLVKRKTQPEDIESKKIGVFVSMVKLCESLLILTNSPLVKVSLLKPQKAMALP